MRDSQRGGLDGIFAGQGLTSIGYRTGLHVVAWTGRGQPPGRSHQGL